MATVRRKASTALVLFWNAAALGTLITKLPVAMKMAANPVVKPKPTPRAIPMAALIDTPAATPMAVAELAGGGPTPQVKQVHEFSSPQSLQSQKLSLMKYTGISQPSLHRKGTVVVELVDVELVDVVLVEELLVVVVVKLCVVEEL